MDSIRYSAERLDMEQKPQGHHFQWMLLMTRTATYLDGAPCFLQLIILCHIHVQAWQSIIVYMHTHMYSVHMYIVLNAAVKWMLQ